jgi:hypothetical protein
MQKVLEALLTELIQEDDYLRTELLAGLEAVCE